MHSTTTRITVTLIGLSMLGAAPTPAAAQPPGRSIGFQYNLMTSGEVGQNLNGVAVDFDSPIFGDHLTLAGGGAFVTTTASNATISQTFFGAGPGIRHDTGTLEVWAHALLGYRRDAGRIGRLSGGHSGFDGRFATGVDYPLNERYRLRAGVAYSGNTHVTLGLSTRW
ncbi:MAG: hypothetical protein OXF78_10760 [Rhodospirillales bacterium]|nr:hypothetical protein [Rhodospirillales bacterium]